MSDLALIEQAAREAGEVAVQMREAGLAIEHKENGTPVTNADLRVDQLLKEHLGAARPDYGWLSEETADNIDRLEQRRLFVVDPIDGTAAYMKGRPWWAVSIAVVEDGRPVAGVVHAPSLGETYLAERGKGATLNGDVIRASDVAEVEDCAMLGDAQMFLHPAWPVKWPTMRVETRNSIAYRMCLVASGAFDAAIALTGKNEWDLAAADLICAEAGARATDHLGRAFIYNDPNPRAPSLICAAPALHPLLIERVNHIELS
ncbi:MAG TPA: 3'(2'),5'-bisphosphate nucleotidase CysQ [Caulobacteraceae bacterium]|nr:3'(2'),5'-bisphosphate nucleotidase CysQ [Caulobacteraceae bacterium]